MGSAQDAGSGYGPIGSFIGAGIDAFAHPDTSLNKKDKQALRDAGWTIERQGTFRKYITPDGQVVDNIQQLKNIAKQLRRNPPSPDITNTPPLIPALPLPNIPPLIIGAGRTILGQIPPLIIAGGLFWPSTAGKGSDLRDYWMKNAPQPRGPRTRGGRRGRARAKPRRGRRPRAVSKPKVPVTWPGRAGPVTISRPGRRAIPPPVVETGGNIPPRDTRPLPGTELGDWDKPWSRWEPPPGAIPKPAPAPTSSATSSATSSSPAKSSSTSSSKPGTAAPAIPGTPAPSVLAKIGLPTTVSGWLSMIGANIGPSLFQAFNPQPRAKPLPQLAPAPLTWPQASAVPYAAQQVASRECSCAKTRTRKRNTCRNPVTKRKRETRGGHKFVTVTKRLDCERGKQT